MLQKRSDRWAEKSLGWLDDVGNLGAVLSPTGAADDDEARGAGRWPLTWINNLNTGEGPEALDQFVTDRALGFPLMRLTPAAGGEDGRPRLLVHDRRHGRDVQACCAHFSGSLKTYLDLRWLERRWGVKVGAGASPGTSRELC